MDSISSDAPLKQCSRCKQWKPATAEHFPRAATEKDGLTYHCKDCQRKANAKRYPPKPPRYKDGLKRCIACGEYKPAAPGYFYRSKKYPDGLNSRCKQCHKTAHPTPPAPGTLKQ